MTGLPIRIAIRVDFSDGSEHEYEVRGPDAVEPPGPLQGFWPAAVVTADVAERMKHDNARSQALADAVFRLSEIRDWVAHHQAAYGEPGPVRYPLEDGEQRGFLAAVSEVLTILDRP